MSLPNKATDTDALLTRFAEVRARTRALVADLSDADATVQSMPDASPAKWHLAHTSWFFETFVLETPPWRPHYDVLFNSYYVGVGERHRRDARGMLTRPALSEIMAYRSHVDAEVLRRWDGLDHGLIELGCHHEEQHQELLLTDILHLFAQNPLRPAPCPSLELPELEGGRGGWQDYLGGKVRIGTDAGFHFDCEGPEHTVWLEPFALGERLVTEGEWAEFTADGGYTTPALWLSDGWDWVQREGIAAPLYAEDGMSLHMSLLGPREVGADEPVRHVSYFEADAYARWAGARLPTEAEWEHAARTAVLPGMYGALWQWTASDFAPYPGYVPAPGAVGEYNGKFMNGLRVLRGSSFATPPGHSRASYRNFFAPHTRWQFTGLRLAR